MASRSSSQLFSIVLLTLIVVGSVAFVLPLKDKVDTLVVQRDTLLSESSMAAEKYTNLSTLADELSKSEATRQAYLNLVPKGYEQDELITDLSSIAEEHGFDLSNMSFSEVASQDFGNTLRISGNYSGPSSSLEDLLKALETADRLYRVVTVNVQQSDTRTVVFNLMLETYYQ